ncbi:MAG: hypothetical protein QF415_05040 [Candidatus Undinarchaeales archaeon]|jgi:hypothetical protein|nr:hypothetical protein [Candidatus Undinarchaeales archaeon]MDP7494531.1 hypothetical protein [Candidatus Undinarchaeales archaeon]
MGGLPWRGVGDIELLRRTGRIGANHTDRFRLLRAGNPELYRIAHKLFRFYRDSYNKTISEPVSRQVRENVRAARRLVLG